MNRKEILAAANKAVHAEDMDHDYGKPEDNFQTIAELWTTYLKASVCDYLELDARDVAAMMILLKVARAATSTKCDHWVDIAGYAACGGEIDGTPFEEIRPAHKEETATVYADNKEFKTISLQSLGDITGEGNGPFELRFTVKKEDE